MSSLDCTKAEQWIAEDLDGGLNAEKSSLLAHHIEHCPRCRQTRDELAMILGALAEDVPEDPGEEFWSRYHSSLDARLREKSLSRSSRGWALGWRTVSIGLAALLAGVIVLAGYVYRSHMTPQHQTAMTPALIEELQRLYGPVPEEMAPHYSADPGNQVRLVMDQNGNRDAEMFVGWFEVEDESNFSLL